MLGQMTTGGGYSGVSENYDHIGSTMHVSKELH